MDGAALKAELEGDPAGLGYDGQTSNRKAELLNAMSRAGGVAVGELHQALDNMADANGVPVWEWIEGHAADASAAGMACRAAIRLRNAHPSYPAVRTRGATFVAMTQTIVAAGGMTDAQAEALRALADDQVSRAQELGLGVVTTHDVELAEAL